MPLGQVLVSAAIFAAARLKYVRMLSPWFGTSLGWRSCGGRQTREGPHFLHGAKKHAVVICIYIDPEQLCATDLVEDHVIIHHVPRGFNCQRTRISDVHCVAAWILR